VINETAVSKSIENGCITIGRIAPDFTTISTQGPITLSQFRGKWVLLFSEPRAFTAITNTTFIELSRHYSEFEKRNVQILALTLDNNFANIEWVVDIYDHFGIMIPFPILEDRDNNIVTSYNIVNPDRIYERSVRDLFVINPEGIVSLIMTYPVSCGRNLYEILRVIDSLQLTEKYNVYTPMNWMPGDPVIVPVPNNVNEAFIRNQNGSSLGLNCDTWYNCFKDYNSLVRNQ
jgi:peroxiredoxin (alkyl hydroperoxide reductase subunit C)